MGPFVTNSESEMKQVMLDFQNEKMGVFRLKFNCLLASPITIATELLILSDRNPFCMGIVSLS